MGLSREEALDLYDRDVYGWWTATHSERSVVVKGDSRKRDDVGKLSEDSGCAQLLLSDQHVLAGDGKANWYFDRWW